MECVPTTIYQRFSSLLVLESSQVGLHRWGQLLREINYSSLIESKPGSIYRPICLTRVDLVLVAIYHLSGASLQINKYSRGLLVQSKYQLL